MTGSVATNVRLADLAHGPDGIREEAARLLVDGFSEPRGWPGIEPARAEVAMVLRDGFARAAFDGDMLAGWIGGLPEYGGRVWELHPLVVRPDRRRRGVGRALVGAFEDEARRRGGLTATLGTDDDSGMTSLADVDLYPDVPGAIRDLRDLGRGHPFLFYLKLGYVVTGVVPDANGTGRPDIFMCRRLAPDAGSLPSRAQRASQTAAAISTPSTESTR